MNYTVVTQPCHSLDLIREDITGSYPWDNCVAVTAWEDLLGIQPSESKWRNHGVRIVHSDELDLNTPQTPGMSRAAAINPRARGRREALGGNGCHPSQGQDRALTIMGPSRA